MEEKIKSEECTNGFILDGFTRNRGQADMVDEIVKIDKAVEILNLDLYPESRKAHALRGYLNFWFDKQ